MCLRHTIGNFIATAETARLTVHGGYRLGYNELVLVGLTKQYGQPLLEIAYLSELPTTIQHDTRILYPLHSSSMHRNIDLKADGL
jgi:hypothetical protein